MKVVDVVIVSYNSRTHLRRCVEALSSVDWVRVIVVDNASPDKSPEVVADLSIEVIERAQNGGFASGCNVGTRAGTSRFVLLLNPDAELDAESLATLVDTIDEHPAAGAVGPKIVHRDGSLDYSIRRFPRLRSTFARAFFLHRAFPYASWSDEVVRDDSVYGSGSEQQWVSGACILIRRSCLEAIGGLDEGFFMYCEDKDLCARIWESGSTVRFEPRAVCIHDGGGSAPEDSMLPVLAASRIRYAEKHGGRPAAVLERIGLIFHEAIRTLIPYVGSGVRAGHFRSLLELIRPTT